MQLEKVVSYHKALADPTRIRMLTLLAGGEMNGLTLAEKLAVTPATVTHHAGKLRQASLIRERRDKNTIYFSLNHEFLRTSADATLELIYRHANAVVTQPLTEGEKEAMSEENIRFKDSVIHNFFSKEGQLKSIPVQLKKKLITLEYMVEKLTPGQKYTEREINEFIKNYHPDFATIRREFIMHQFMYRENQVYECNPQELWTRWERLS